MIMMIIITIIIIILSHFYNAGTKEMNKLGFIDITVNS